MRFGGSVQESVRDLDFSGVGRRRSVGSEEAKLRKEFASLVPSTLIQRYDFCGKRRVNADLLLSPSEPPSGGPLSSFLLEFAKRLFIPGHVGVLDR